MVQSLRLFLLIIAFSIFSISILSQTENKEFQVQFSFEKGKTVYQIGEPIRVVISFTAKVPGYKIQTIQSPATETITISPTDGVYDWRYRIDHLYYLEDIFTFKPLSDKPVNVTITLNNYFRFDKLGKYSLKLATNRVYYSSPNSKNIESYERKENPIVSNNLDFEIKEMSEADEKAEIARLTALIKDQKGELERRNLYKELSFLTGDPSTIEKVKRFLNPENFGDDLLSGLLIARNKSLAIKLLEEALQDSNRTDIPNLIYILSELRLSQESDTNPSFYNETEIWKFLEKRQKRVEEIKQSYIYQVFESLPKRSEKNQITTALTIFTQLPKEDNSSEAFKTTKAIVLNNFDKLPLNEQTNLLSYSWEKLKTPLLIPSLEKILTSKVPPQYSFTVLKRLIELDKIRARPFILAEILNPQSPFDAELLGSLDDKFLPEVEDSLLAQIRELSPLKKGNTDNYLLRTKSSLIVRYATSKIYDGLLEIYKKYEDKWSEDVRFSFLAYFAKYYNEKEAISLAEERINKAENFGFSQISNYLSKFKLTKRIEKLFRKYLESNDLQITISSANFLSKYVSKENQKFIEKRYNRWLKEWKPRQQEFNESKPNKIIQLQIGFQGNMINALKNAKSWKLTDNEINRLKETCFSENCIRYFIKEKLP